jgi:hypothetical protein
MYTITKIMSAASVALVMGATSSSAALIDFTSNAVSVGPGTEGGGWTLTGSSPANTGYTGPGAYGVLAGENDGIGINNDELSGPQFVTITFNKMVKLTGVYALDLYISNRDSDNYESAYVSKGGSPLTPPNDIMEAQQTLGGGLNLPGYAGQVVSLKGTQFTFSVGIANPGIGSGGTGNDDSGQRDYALAAIEISAVPLPAGMLLFGTALGGLGLMRRRKKA